MNKQAKLTVLAGETLAWATRIGCNQKVTKAHSYFTFDMWTKEFNESFAIFKEVKPVMIENGINIAVKGGPNGHYISEEAVDAVSNMDYHLKNINTRLETVKALWHSSLRSKYHKDLEAMIGDIRELIEDNGTAIDFNKLYDGK